METALSHQRMNRSLDHDCHIQDPDEKCNFNQTKLCLKNKRFAICKDVCWRSHTDKVKHDILAASRPAAQAFRSATLKANFWDGDDGDLLKVGDDGVRAREKSCCIVVQPSTSAMHQNEDLMMRFLF